MKGSPCDRACPSRRDTRQRPPAPSAVRALAFMDAEIGEARASLDVPGSYGSPMMECAYAVNERRPDIHRHALKGAGLEPARADLKNVPRPRLRKQALQIRRDRPMRHLQKSRAGSPFEPRPCAVPTLLLSERSDAVHQGDLYPLTDRARASRISAHRPPSPRAAIRAAHLPAS